MTSLVIAILHWSIIVALSLRVMVRRRPIGVSLAWLAVICSVPFVGAALYLMFGENRLGKRRAERAEAMIGTVRSWLQAVRGDGDATSVAATAPEGSMARHAEHALGIPPLAGNRLELLDDTESIFDVLVADIDAAKARCLLGFYIWHEGGRADDVIAALVRAAERGVECRVSADAMGSKVFLRGGRIDSLRDAGVKVVAALPTGLLRSLFVRADLRNHRKIAVIDDRIGYTGSQNLVDPDFFKQDAGVGQWVDAMVRVEGPSVPVLSALFLHDWSLETGESLELPSAEKLPGLEIEPGAIAQVVPSGPGTHPEVIHQLLLTTMFEAREELIITTPYFVPDESILTALISAATRGVAVTLIIPERNDSLLVRYASAAHLDDLMAAGVCIARFRDGLLHTKSITMDGAFSVFGSVNLDMRSLWLNFEISLFVYDSEFTTRLRALQHSYLERSDLLGLETWRKRGAGQRLAEDALRLASPLL